MQIRFTNYTLLVNYTQGLCVMDGMVTGYWWPVVSNFSSAFVTICVLVEACISREWCARHPRCYTQAKANTHLKGVIRGKLGLIPHRGWVIWRDSPNPFPDWFPFGITPLLAEQACSARLGLAGIMA
ncbi:hypothetical protein PAHAL_7G062300 [Panicum hallii]|jgi:hypothetical protein|uniref:Uncharacterized protein n=1 Tax=Panicum hallii TaxID=206008 RepID=A0A2T8IB45_9POAL|nr:hypothetical protein PAHAL_7G062300 [Panicum hallii]